LFKRISAGFLRALHQSMGCDQRPAAAFATLSADLLQARRMTTELDFETVDQALTRAETGINASEGHGTLCGLLCAQQPFDAQTWLLHTLIATDSESASVAETRKLLVRLAETVARQLSDVDFGFTLLLPDDEQPLQTRTLAMSQ